MRALLSVEAGGPETLQLRHIPIPEPKAGEVRIRVAACAINYPDALVIEDRYQFRPERPFSPGGEVSGIVDAAGPSSTSFGVGERVLAGNIFGGLADYVIMPESACYALPAEMPFDQAAAFLMTYGTSYHALKDRAQVRAGESLMVLGAAGGVGLAAVELGKQMGLRVIAGVSSEKKAKVARSRGADAVVVYPPGPLDRDQASELTAGIKAAAGGEVNVVYDPVGGSFAEPALRALSWDGRYLVVGFPAGIPSIPLNLPLLKGVKIIGVFWGASSTDSQIRTGLTSPKS
jgi:NADPH2:quinone reductase